MTEERIKELQHLLYRRDIVENEIQAFIQLLNVDKEDRSYTINDARFDSGKNCLHIIKDRHGYIDEALQKIKAEYQKELVDIQKAIMEF